jgi:7-keto-8-aminopelargonate synthetase-like enzyme
VLLPTGFLGDLAVGQALAGQFTNALIDERAHGSLVTAARFLNCPIKTFPHRNPAALAQAIKRCGPRRQIIILTDGLFSADGSVAPLAEYLTVLPANGMILVDDAHGAGILGPHGRGTPEHAGVDRRRIIQTMTLSKALGAYGGAVLASRELCDHIMTTGISFVGATPLPLPLAAAALAALNLLVANSAWRTRLFANAQWMTLELRTHGVPVPKTPGPIVSLPTLTPRATASLRRALLAADIFPSLTHYPGGPTEGCYRFVISSAHTRRQLQQLTKVLIAHVQ